jgi:2-polyprenyl-6-hydroxyphenyl methylase / 3-demethylubiquinone-9 3-methyltransferase
MTFDCRLYDRMAGSWWDEHGFLHALTALNPSRFGYMRRVLVEDLHRDPADLEILDVGCGGGLLAEEFARLGSSVTGVDPSTKSLEAARRHAADAGLSIHYEAGVAEELPFRDASFDAVYCCDVLEHVDDLDRVIGETARVLKPGGAFLFDTINRTWRSWFVMIFLLQDWNWTRCTPRNLHDWRKFIRPERLQDLLVRHGLAPASFRGMEPRVGFFRVLRALRRRRRGQISFYEAFRQMKLGESLHVGVQYLGYARKAP